MLRTARSEFVQLTPPSSGSSIQIGKGLTDAPAGSLRNIYLVVTDIEAARCRLLERGVKPADGNVLVCCSQPVRDGVIDL